MNSEYLDVISLIERLHRQFLELVKLELDAMDVRDINNPQHRSIGKTDPTRPSLPSRVSCRTIDANPSRGVRLTRLASDRRALPEPSCYPAGPSCAPKAGRMVRT
jgi:hypothetical protein